MKPRFRLFSPLSFLPKADREWCQGWEEPGAGEGGFDGAGGGLLPRPPRQPARLRALRRGDRRRQPPPHAPRLRPRQERPRQARTLPLLPGPVEWVEGEWGEWVQTENQFTEVLDEYCGQAEVFERISRGLVADLVSAPFPTLPTPTSKRSGSCRSRGRTGSCSPTASRAPGRRSR